MIILTYIREEIKFLTRGVIWRTECKNLAKFTDEALSSMV